MADCVPDSSNAIEADEEVEDEQHSSGSVDEVGRFYFDNEDDEGDDLLTRSAFFGFDKEDDEEGLLTKATPFLMTLMMMMIPVVAVNRPTSTGTARRRSPGCEAERRW